MDHTSWGWAFGGFVFTSKIDDTTVLVGGWTNPFETYESKWIISPNIKWYISGIFPANGGMDYATDPTL